MNGIKFEIDHNEAKKAYGVVLIKIPSLSYVDERVHESSFNVLWILIGVGIMIIFGFAIYWRVLKMEKNILIEEESGRDNHSVTNYGETSSGVGVTDVSTGIGGFDHKKNIMCDPIQEVSESLEMSQPGTKALDSKSNEKVVENDET